MAENTLSEGYSNPRYILTSISMETPKKFHDMKVYNDNTVRITHGKLEGDVKDKIKRFGSPEAAFKFVQETIKRKEFKGYVRV